MGEALVKLYKKMQFVIGEDILKAIKKHNLTLDEALLIIYFCGNNIHPVLDIDDISNKFGQSELEIMKAFENITNKNLIGIKMIKNKDNKMEEIIDLNPFYESIAIEIDSKAQKENKDNVYSLFEEEFGRPLSSMEYELISSWIDSGIKSSLIKAALKEAIFNGSLTLRYIDGILREWKRNGIKDEKDVNLHLKKKSSKPKIKQKELFDYNWLDDDE